MHPALIKAAIAMANTQQADIAEELKVARSTVHSVIEGNTRSKRVELRIAAIINRPLTEIWPQWYGPKASRRRRLSAAEIQAALKTLPTAARN